MLMQRFLLCWSAISLCGALLFAADQIPIRYSADPGSVRVEFSDDGRMETAILSGNVKVVTEHAVITGTRAVFSVANGTVEVEEGVTVESDYGTFTAEKIIYNVHAGTGVLTGASFIIPPFYGKAKTITRTSDRFIINDGYFTTCEKDPPHYSTRCEKITILPGKYVKGEKIRVVFGEKFNVFYFPRYTQDISRGEPSVLVSPGYKTELGNMLTLKFNHVLREGSDFLSTERFDIGTKGEGAGWRLSSDKEKFDFKLYGFYNTDSREWGTGALGSYVKNLQDAGGVTNLTVAWRGVESAQFFEDYMPSDYYERAQTYNHAALSRSFGPNVLALDIRNTAGEDILSLEKMPELRMTTMPFPLGTSSVWLKNDVRLTRFLSGEEEVDRFLEWVTLETKCRRGSVTMRPWVSAGAVHYRTDGGGEETNVPGEAGVSFSTLLTKINRFGVREYLIPSVDFTVRSMTRTMDELPQLDQVEMLQDGTFCNFDLDWSLWKKGESIGRINLGNAYDIGRQAWGDSSFRYEMRVRQNFSLTGENVWNFSEGHFLSGVNDFLFERDRRRFAFGTRYVRSNINGIETWMEERISRLWKYRAGVYFDLRDNTGISQNLQVWRTLHCWVVGVSIGRDGNNSTSFYLTAIPTVFAEPDTWKRRYEQWR